MVVAHAHTPERAASISQVEAELADIARKHTPKDLRGVVRYLTDALDGDHGATTDEALFERRCHHQSRTLDGMVAYDRICDPEAGGILFAVMHAELERDHRAHDTRTPAQRRSDAHTNLMRRLLDHDAVGGSRNARPHLTYVVDLDELPSTTPEVVTRLRTEARRHGHLSAVTLERLSCDCDISRVITSGRSEVLDVGRATRTIPPPIWKALVVRDQHCQAPGCDQTPYRCEAHHIVHWTRGGPTNLENLQLLCSQRHRQRHNHEAQARAA